MRVGLDFDNTIVRYDALFHQLAHEAGWIPAEMPKSKLLVRDHLRRIDKEDVWTAMQGEAYGGRMADAEAFEGALDFMRWARMKGIDLYIISHKTRHPFLGVQYDLHEAARKWIRASLHDAEGPLVDPDKVFFELTKEEKCTRIGRVGCDRFVDDLPELLTSPEFPKTVKPVLFDPEGNHASAGLPSVRSWAELRHVAESGWLRNP